MIAFQGLLNVGVSILGNSSTCRQTTSLSTSSFTSSRIPPRKCHVSTTSKSMLPNMNLDTRNKTQQSVPSSVEDLPLEYIPDDASDVPETWSRPGVYGIYHEDGVLQYVGRTRDVRRNVVSHIENIGKGGGLLGGVRMILFEDEVADDVLDGLVFNWIRAHESVEGTPPGNREGGSGRWGVSGSGGGVEEVIKGIVEGNDVAVFMKGTRDMPMCGFSDKMVRIVKACVGERFVDVNCLDEGQFPGLRDGIKRFSQWPTIPQLYVGGEFVGGSDVAMEMYEQGSLQQMFEDAIDDSKSKVDEEAPSEPMSVHDQIKYLVENNRVVCFMKGTMNMPLCGFSDRMVGILKACLNENFVTVNCLDEDRNPGLREGIKSYSNWPTLPQLYVDGELVGGSDVVMQLYQDGELETMLAPVIEDMMGNQVKDTLSSGSRAGEAVSSISQTNTNMAVPVEFGLEPPPPERDSQSEGSSQSAQFNSDQFVNALWNQTKDAAVRELAEMRKMPLEIIPTSSNHFPDTWARPGVYGVYSDIQELQYIGRSRDVRASLVNHIDKIGRHDGKIHAVRMRTYDADVDEDILNELANAWVLQRSLRGSGPPPGNSSTNSEWRDVTSENRSKENVVGIEIDSSGENVEEQLRRVLQENRIVLFVQGTQERPMCDESAAASRMLTEAIEDQFVCVHCLDEQRNPGLRDAIQRISGSASIPQLFVDGKYKGGVDLIKQMQQGKQLGSLVY